ncbi:MAG: hypothetical protein JWM31_1538 [Solirubrobacterales bacterium]|nr:hypothetical protein [Solirubrobacterales bacterium]
MKFSDALVRAGITPPDERPISDEDLWFTCPGCERSKMLSACDRKDVDAVESTYACNRCGAVIAGVRQGDPARPARADNGMKLGETVIGNTVDLLFVRDGMTQAQKLPATPNFFT